MLVCRAGYGPWGRLPKGASNITLADTASKYFIIRLTLTGEGMKVGIIALLRRHINVTYYTNNEIWEWIFHDWSDPDRQTSSLLTVYLHPCQPKKAMQDPTLSQDVREARRTARRNTTVIVQAKRSLDINFNDYLFLISPPPGTDLTTNLGSILTDAAYRSKIFVKGIFVEERGISDPPPLRYGVDFGKVVLDRDRRNLLTRSQVANTLTEMWDGLISRDQGDAAKGYLEMLLEKNETLETLNARTNLRQVCAEKLFKELRSLVPGKFFYNAEDVEPTEV